MEIPILFEDKDVLVINKPAGLMVHADGKTEKPTLVDWILKERPEIAGVGEVQNGVERPGIVHRLDEDTSGALIIAKNQASFEHLKKQFQDRETEKEYHAFVWGHFKENSGIVDEPIGRNSNDFRRWHAGRGARGEMREAVTTWEVAHQFQDQYGEHFSFMHLFPKTGRTHQLRVHMKFLQRPIVADSLYAPTKPKALGFERLALHARKISFLNLENKRLIIEAPYPSDFQSALAKYSNA
ncbi:MAG TPA: RluA family pseudouridine synthase [Candidatus Paceibacterota bacterium]|jgi:23S rRNA pseudouridine1911/1915/1917 synthase|nr:RluA family pseudouridine synthase [Candidatus Paceibacterota bacterium]